jgi:hypothetical protein
MPLLFVASGSRVNIEEYLSASYRSDCDYVDGILERNAGEYDHHRHRCRGLCIRRVLAPGTITQVPSEPTSARAT